MSVVTPNMNLIQPVIGVDSGLVWEYGINANSAVIDNHNHSFGYGVQITPTGININADLPFNGNNLTLVRSTNYLPQPAPLSNVTDVNCVYVSGVDLYYNDGNSNVVKITSGGTVNATSSGISSGTATASFVSSVLVVNAAVNTPANIQAGSILLGNNVANSKFLTLSPPPSMAANYSLTLPPLPSQTSFLTLDTSGNMIANTTIDGVTIINTAGVLSSTSLTEYQFQANGQYRVGDFVDGLMPFSANATIKSIWIYNLGAGTSGTTEFDLKSAAPGGSFTSILSTTGKITSAAAGNVWTDSGAVVSPQTGVTKPVLSTTSIAAGHTIRFDILTTMTGAANCGVIIQYL